MRDRTILKLNDPPSLFHDVVTRNKFFRVAKGMHGQPGRGDMRYRGRLSDPACAEGLADATYVVWSYETPIAWRLDDGWVIPAIFYGPSTAKHQFLMRQVAELSPGKYRSPDACKI